MTGRNSAGDIRIVLYLFCAIIIPGLVSVTSRLDTPLAGVVVEPEKPSLSVQSLLNGSFQTGFDKYFAFKLHFRPFMTRVYNQLLYTLFNSTDSSSVQIGKNNYLYAPAYPQAYLAEIGEQHASELAEHVRHLVELEEELAHRGKTLAVIISPSKASVFPENLPRCYQPYIEMKEWGLYGDNYYETFKKLCADYGLDYFDFHEQFLAAKEQGEPIFNQSGIHWTGSAMVIYLPAFTHYLNTRLPQEIGSIRVDEKSEIKYGDPFFADGDLESLLNLAFPRYDFPSLHVRTVSHPSAYRPNMFVCGGSFLWEWIHPIMGAGGSENTGGNIVNRIDASFYNSYILRFPGEERIAETTSDFTSIIENDLFIIEMNEAVVSPLLPQFTFVKNLLQFLKEHKTAS